MLKVMFLKGQTIGMLGARSKVAVHRVIKLDEPGCTRIDAIYRRNVVIRATATPPMPGNPLLVKMVESLFKFPPLFKAAAANARKKIVDRGAEMGMDFAHEIEKLKEVDWNGKMVEATDPKVVMPEYYKAPFHAYPEGNLSFDAALEVTVAAKSVHATVMSEDGKTLDPDGDDKLRASYSKCMKELLEEMEVKKDIKDILDVGCATGLSSLELLRAFPNAQVTGIDLSPYMLAVGKYMQSVREIDISDGNKEALTFMHRAAEKTDLPSGSFDLVSICLVCHELPEAASRAIFKEAFRLLRPNGALAIMEMNPYSPAFGKVMSNPIPYVVFKSTEPYLLEYVGMDLHGALKDAGFEQSRQLENSPRHRTCVAVKR